MDIEGLRIPRLVLYVTPFIWLPFAKSAYTAFTSKKKFDELERKEFT